MNNSSALIISSDAIALKTYAQNAAKDYNPADIFWLTGETIGVKEVMDFMERAHLAPLGDGKLMIIMDAAIVTPQAQNKMLKTIEDAPAQTSFLLLATSDTPILNTIKSRCMTKYLPISKSTSPLIPKDIAHTIDKIFGVKIDEKNLNTRQIQSIMNTLAKINRNVAANCNAANANDLLIMEILKNAKNS